MTSVRRQRSPEPGSGGPDISTRIGHQKVKRRRLHTACRICQDRKTRCDGERPTCSTCRRRGVAADCAYDDAAVPPETRAPQDRGSLAAFEERLGRLEQTQGVAASGYEQDNGDTTRRDSFRSATCISLSDEHNYGTPIIRPPATGLPTPHTVQESTEIDGLATVSAFDDGDCLYGASSIIALTRFFRGKVAERNGLPADENPETGCRSTSSRDSHMTIPETIREADIGAGLYPPRPLSDDFVSCFWEFVHPLFPVLHKTSFMQRYHLFWAEQTKFNTLSEPSAQHDQAIFASTLNIIFSLGCQFSTHVPDGKCTTLAYDFYQRSRKLYNHELMDSMSIPLVQMLLLSGVYLQSAQHADRCWNTIGLAIRVAQGLGLHVERPGPWVKGQLDREMRRRIWHCCLVLDRLLSMTFGRPVMISARDGVPTPSLIDDDYLQANGEGFQPTGRPSGLGLLVYSSKLFIILDNILSEFYSSNKGRGITEMTAHNLQADGILSSIMSHNRQLDDFLKEVPSYMRYAALPTSATPEPGEKAVEIQRQILHCRFLYTRLLLFRPVVYLSTKFPDLFLSQSSQTNRHDMDDYLVKFICNSCVQVAFELISAIHRSLGHSHRSSAWHAIYFTFGAAVVLLCTQICPAVDFVALQQDFEQHWGEAQEILNYYRVQRPVARQSLQTLKALRDSVQQHSAAPETATDSQRPVPLFMDFSDFDLLGAGPAALDTLFNLDMSEYSGFN